MENKYTDKEIQKESIEDKTVFEDLDVKHDVSNKHIAFWGTVVIILVLYLGAGYFLYQAFAIAKSKPQDNWLLLTFSLVFLSFPFSIHFGLLHKLYRKKTENDGVSNMVNHPLANALAELLKVIADKVGK